jgi:DNA-binding NarL/FixJ family response regulator
VTRPVTVLVVDDNAVVRTGLRALLDPAPQVHVVGEAWDGAQAVDLTRRLLPDIVLLDVRMPRQDGVSVARDIASVARVMMMTFTDDAETIREAVDAGACGYLVHGAFNPADLVSNILTVAHGSGVFSAEALAALRTPAPTPAMSRTDPAVRGRELRLSERQAEILDLIASGLSNRDIAVRCFLAEKTVKNHINRIFAALGVTTRAEAIALWFGSYPAATGRTAPPGPMLGPTLGPTLGPRAPGTRR